MATEHFYALIVITARRNFFTFSISANLRGHLFRLSVYIAYQLRNTYRNFFFVRVMEVWNADCRFHRNCEGKKSKFVKPISNQHDISKFLLMLIAFIENEIIIHSINATTYSELWPLHYRCTLDEWPVWIPRRNESINDMNEWTNEWMNKSTNVWVREWVRTNELSSWMNTTEWHEWLNECPDMNE